MRCPLVGDVNGRVVDEARRDPEWCREVRACT